MPTRVQNLKSLALAVNNSAVVTELISFLEKVAEFDSLSGTVLKALLVV